MSLRVVIVSCPFFDAERLRTERPRMHEMSWRRNIPPLPPTLKWVYQHLVETGDAPFITRNVDSGFARMPL